MPLEQDLPTPRVDSPGIISRKKREKLMGSFSLPPLGELGVLAVQFRIPRADDSHETRLAIILVSIKRIA
jgi:hypothetical protein